MCVCTMQQRAHWLADEAGDAFYNQNKSETSEIFYFLLFSTTKCLKRISNMYLTNLYIIFNI